MESNKKNTIDSTTNSDFEVCELCTLVYDIKDMRLESEEGNWICNGCINDVEQPINYGSLIKNTKYARKY